MLSSSQMITPNFKQNGTYVIIQTDDKISANIHWDGNINLTTKPDDTIFVIIQPDDKTKMKGEYYQNIILQPDEASVL